VKNGSNASDQWSKSADVISVKMSDNKNVNVRYPESRETLTEWWLGTTCVDQCDTSGIAHHNRIPLAYITLRPGPFVRRASPCHATRSHR
jgi:hypothetical protein